MLAENEKYCYKPVKIKLEQPVELDGVAIEHLHMRPPKARDVINACDMAPSKNQEDALLFANLCNVTIQTVLDMAYYDYKQLEAAYDRFLYPARQHCEMQSLPLPEVLEASAL